MEMAALILIDQAGPRMLNPEATFVVRCPLGRPTFSDACHVTKHMGEIDGQI